VDHYTKNAKDIPPTMSEMVLSGDELNRKNKLYDFYLPQKVEDGGLGIQVRDASKEIRFNNVIYNDGLRPASPDLVKGSNV
jgi:hypothetical protein